MDRFHTGSVDAVILDVQCFKDNTNDLLLKEVSVVEVNSGTILLHHIAKPPFDRDSLTEEKLRESYWLTKHCHGLEWDRGDIPYYVLMDKLRTCLTRRTLVYVKGSEKKEFVQRNFIIDPVTTTVVDMSDLGCGSLTSTSNLLSTNVVRCGQHKRRGTHKRCALANCTVLRGWLFLTANNNDHDIKDNNDVDDIASGSGSSFTSCFCTCPCHLTTTISTETINSAFGIDTVQ